MAAFTRVNGGVGAPGALYSTVQTAGYVITCKNTGGSAVNIQASTGVDGVIESVIREVAPLMAWAPNDNTGIIHVVVDSHANSAATLLARLENIDGVGSDSAVAAAASFVIS